VEETSEAEPASEDPEKRRKKSHAYWIVKNSWGASKSWEQLL
jgi:hypothetical protein